MNENSINRRATVRNLVIFIIVVLTIGWIGRGLDTLMGNPSSESLGMLIWLVTPLGISFLLRTFAGDGWQDLGIRPNFKGNGVWYIIALLIYPVVTVVVLMLGNGLGLISFPNFSFN